MKSRKQQKTVIAALCLVFIGLLPGCSAYTPVEFDPARPHHGDGEFVTLHKPSLVKYFFMRLREGGAPPRDPAEVASIVGRADLELIHADAERPRVTWIGHASTLVQYRGINFLTDPHLSQYPFTYAMYVEPRYTQPGLAFEQIPPIDFVVISHNHFDSLDRDTVKKFGFLVRALGAEGLVSQTGYRGRARDRARLVAKSSFQRSRRGHVDAGAALVETHALGYQQNPVGRLGRRGRRFQ